MKDKVNTMVGNGQLYELRTIPDLMNGSSTLTPTPTTLTLGDWAKCTELIARLVKTHHVQSPHIQLLPNLLTPKHCKGVGRTDHHVNRPTSDAHLSIGVDKHKGCGAECTTSDGHRFHYETKIDEIGQQSDGYATKTKITRGTTLGGFGGLVGKSS